MENLNKSNIKEIDLNSIRSSKYQKNIDLYGEDANTCLICGKRITSELNLFVHLTTDGNLTTASDSEINNSQGSFPVGSCCAKKLSKEFIQK